MAKAIEVWISHEVDQPDHVSCYHARTSLAGRRFEIVRELEDGEVSNWREFLRSELSDEIQVLVDQKHADRVRSARVISRARWVGIAASTPIILLVPLFVFLACPLKEQSSVQVEAAGVCIESITAEEYFAGRVSLPIHDVENYFVEASAWDVDALAKCARRAVEWGSSVDDPRKGNVVQLARAVLKRMGKERAFQALKEDGLLSDAERVELLAAAMRLIDG